MLFIVPSRSRPENIVELIDAFAATRSYARLLVAVDDDDPTLPGYEAITLPDWVSLKVAPHMRMAGTLNHWAVQHANSITEGREIIGFMGDDHRPRTHKWDLAISKAAFDAGWSSVVYGNDLIQGKNLATAVAMTSDIVKALGYMCPPGSKHLYLDNAWMEIGKTLGRLLYLPDVVIEHCHPIAQKGVEWDEQYKEVNSGDMYTHDERVFKDWKAAGEYKPILEGLLHG